jgi:hypothetical protein
MSAIDELKTTLDNKVNMGKYKAPCFVEDENVRENDGIFLFYTGNNDTYKIGRFSQQGYFTQEVQIAVRHIDYDTARSTAFKAIKYLSLTENRNDYTNGLHFIPGAPPRYLGTDERTGAYWWGFEINVKGGDS